jgi:hypothetical protein
VAGGVQKVVKVARTGVRRARHGLAGQTKRGVCCGRGSKFSSSTLRNFCVACPHRTTSRRQAPGAPPRKQKLKEMLWREENRNSRPAFQTVHRPMCKLCWMLSGAWQCLSRRSGRRALSCDHCRAGSNSLRTGKWLDSSCHTGFLCQHECCSVGMTSGGCPTQCFVHFKLFKLYMKNMWTLSYGCTIVWMWGTLASKIPRWTPSNIPRWTPGECSRFTDASCPSGSGADVARLRQLPALPGDPGRRLSIQKWRSSMPRPRVRPLEFVGL